MDLFREWDLYERIGRANYMRQREIAAAIRDALRQRAGPLRVLDLGCGDGAMTHEILRDRHVKRFVGVDRSESAIQRLGRRPPPGTSPDEVHRILVCGDMVGEISRFPDLGFDLVHAGYSLHHYSDDDKERALGEIARILEPEGWLIWTDVVRIEGESREEYMRRLGADIESNWGAISPEERSSVVAHILASDFPEAESWMVDRVEAQGLRLWSRLFRDSHYTTLLFSKPGPGREPEGLV